MNNWKFAKVIFVVLLSLIGSAFSSTSASAGERHFVLISTSGSPVWKASADLYAQNGAPVYHWNQSKRSGGKALWYFTWNGDNGWIDVDLSAVGVFVWKTENIKKRISLNQDHCFKVSSFGEVSYTGNNTTGCNSR